MINNLPDVARKVHVLCGVGVRVYSSSARKGGRRGRGEWETGVACRRRRRRRRRRKENNVRCDAGLLNLITVFLALVLSCLLLLSIVSSFPLSPLNSMRHC